MNIAAKTSGFAVFDEVLPPEAFAALANGAACVVSSPVHIIDPHSPIWSIDGPLPASSYPWPPIGNFDPVHPFRILLEAFLEMARANSSLIVPGKLWTRVQAHVHSLRRGTKLRRHVDGHSAASFAFYAHSTWDPEWGGDMLLPTTDGICMAVSPLPNRCVMTMGTQLHAISRIDPDAGAAERVSIVGFLIE